MRCLVGVHPAAYRALNQLLHTACAPIIAAVDTSVSIEEVSSDPSSSSSSIVHPHHHHPSSSSSSSASPNQTNSKGSRALLSTNDDGVPLLRLYHVRSYFVLDQNHDVPMYRQQFLNAMLRMRTAYNDWLVTQVLNHQSIHSYTTTESAAHHFPCYRLSEVRTVGERASIDLFWFTEMEVLNDAAVVSRVTVWQPHSQKLILGSTHRCRIVQTR